MSKPKPDAAAWYKLSAKETEQAKIAEEQRKIREILTKK